MPIVLPAAQVQRGPEWANMEATQQGFQSLLGGLASIQDAQKQNEERRQMALLAQVLQEPDPVKRQAGLVQLVSPQQPEQGMLGKVLNPLNPMGRYNGTTGLQAGIANALLGNALRPQEDIDAKMAYANYMNRYGTSSDGIRAVSSQKPDYTDYLTDEERAQAARIKAGLEPKATAPKPPKENAPKPDKTVDPENTISRLKKQRSLMVDKEGNILPGKEDMVAKIDARIEQLSKESLAMGGVYSDDYRPGSMNPLPPQTPPTTNAGPSVDAQRLQTDPDYWFQTASQSLAMGTPLENIPVPEIVEQTRPDLIQKLLGR